MKRFVFGLTSVSAVLVACSGDTTSGDLFTSGDASFDGTTATVGDAGPGARVDAGGPASGDDAGVGTSPDATTACTATSCTNGQVCVKGTCAAPSCTDGVKDGSESDVDCGGSCGPCNDGRACGQTSDCTSGICTTSVCVAATCGDGMKDGSETDTDCGGASCAPCGTGGACQAATDCASADCVTNACVAASCTDTIQNEGETATDCGGPNCAACADTLACKIDQDCVDKVCANGTCSSPSCTDGVQNGNETGTDCGGGTCGTCGAGQGCLATTDCADKVCTGNACQAATCSDSTTNGNETGVDCGGGTCPACAIGQMCKVDSDCASAALCENGSCTAVKSCADIHTAHPTAVSGVFTIQPGTTPLTVYCDMSTTVGTGGWTLILKTTNGATLAYGADYWTNGATTLNDTAAGEPNTTLGTDTKYAAFNQVPVTQLRADLDGFSYTLAVTAPSAASLFATTVTATPAPTTDPVYPTPAQQPIESDPNFAFQPYCHVYGINTNFGGATAVRFGFTANENGSAAATDCSSNDTGIGLGLEVNGGNYGSGFVCNYAPCTQYSATAADNDGTQVNTQNVAASGRLWVK